MFLRFLSTILLLITLTGAVSAATINVPADQPTIQAGINAAAIGDTVLVAPGTYTENIAFNARRIVLMSSDGPELTILQPLDPNTATVSIVNREDSTTEFRGFSVTGGGPTHTFLISNGALATISHNRFYNNIPIGSRNVEVISCADASPVITRNVFYGNGGIGCIGLRYGAQDTWIINNTFDGNERGFFSIAGGGYAINNIVTNSLERGIGARYTYDFTLLAYNDVWNNSWNYAPSNLEGPDDIQEDPLYLDQFAHNYTLQPWSPCIDAGHPDPQYNDPDGSRSDIGAETVTGGYPYPGGINMGAVDIAHVIDHAPTFYWTFVDTLPVQLGYEFEVGTDFDWTVAEMWSTGAVTGSDNSVVYSGTPLEDGETYNYRVRLSNGLIWGDWAENLFRMNSAPSAPEPISPIGGALPHYLLVRLTTANAVDAEEDGLTYYFELYDDPTLSILIASFDEMAEEEPTTQTEIVSGLFSGQTYWWRVQAFDGFEMSGWAATESFTTRKGGFVINVPGDYPTIQGGLDNAHNGDTVLVGPGVYTENLVLIGRRLVIMSSGGAELTTLTPLDPDEHALVIVDVAEDGTVLSGFTVTGGGPVHTIALNRCGSVLVTNNIFRDNIPVGSNNVEVITCVSPVTVTRNIFYGNGGIGCVGMRGGSQGSFIINNTFDGNERGFFSVNYDVTALNNIIVNSLERGVGAIGPGNFSPLDYNNLWNNNPNYDAGGIGGGNDVLADPMFVDLAAHDYRLRAGSPCIDAGHPDAMYNDPDGTRADIGALPGAFCCVGYRGNIDDDPAEGITISDLMYLVDYMFRGGPEPACFDEADVDADDLVGIADLTYMIDYMFLGGLAPLLCD